MDAAVVEIERHHPAATALFVGDQIDGEIFDEEFRGVSHRLAVERVQHGMTGAVGSRAGALRGALAEMRGHAAERALVDAAVLRARERHAPVLELVDGGRRVAAQIFDRVLVAEPVRALDGVVHVPAPIVLAHVAERGRDTALGRDRMRAGREHLGDAGGVQAGLAAADHGAQPGAAGADNHHVVGVILDRVRAPIHHRDGAAIRTAIGHRLTLRTKSSGSQRPPPTRSRSKRRCSRSGEPVWKLRHGRNPR